jgi:N-acetylglucosamine repressor
MSRGIDQASVRKLGRADLRRKNKWLLLHLIQALGPNSQAELARRSGLSPTTVSGILQPLVEARVLVEEGKTLFRLGRKASILAFNPRTLLTAAVVVDQEECEVALVDLSARVVDHAAFGYPRYSGPMEVVERAAAHLAAMAERNGLDPKGLLGVGVAIPGLVDAVSGVVHVAANLGWRNVHLRALFEEKTGLRTRIEHLGRAKARAEATWGKGTEHRNFVCLEIGSGLGAGVMVDGRILSGASAWAGEVGHTPIDPDGPRCACGRNGCLEVYCATPGIRRCLLECLEAAGAMRSRLSMASTLADLSEASREGDPVAQRVLEETARRLAQGITGIIWNFDPEVIIVSGAVARQWPELIEATRAVLSAGVTVRSLEVPLVPASQEADAGVIAASARVLFAAIEELADGDAAHPGAQAAGREASAETSAAALAGGPRPGGE